MQVEIYRNLIMEDNAKVRWFRQLLAGRKWAAVPPLRPGKYCRWWQ
jgi:hypothetical protein